MEDLKRKLLIIEDGLTVQLMEKKLFIEEGYTVICTTTGEEGIELAKKESPDIAIIDTVLPGIDGYETCKKIREIEGLKVKIVINSGKEESEEDLKKSKEVGADDYIVKDSDFAPLIEAVRKLS
jgi:DNA-binding response OmpR family regulator